MLSPLLIDVLHVLLLNMAAIEEHGAAQVSRSRGADNPASEALLHQVRDIARMINMGVGQHHDVDGRGREGEFPVPPPGFLAFALVQAAVEKNALTVPREQML